jgi:hypothetical protein
MDFAKEVHHIKDWLFLGSGQLAMPMGREYMGIAMVVFSLRTLP